MITNAIQVSQQVIGTTVLQQNTFIPVCQTCKRSVDVNSGRKYGGPLFCYTID